MSLYIRNNISLKPFNTFGLDVYAKHFCVVHSRNELMKLVTELISDYPKFMVLGGGSNVLFMHDYEGLVIKNEIISIEKHKEDENHVWIEVGSGTNWHDLVLYCVEREWGGLENLSLIPGTVGAAPMQNIGAYGVEQESCFIQLDAIDIKTADGYIFHKKECNFGYRDSIFKHEGLGRFFIASVQYKLSKKPKLNTSYGDIKKILQQKQIDQPTVQDISDVVSDIRRSKLPDPNDIGNAGSFFKNPEVSKDFFHTLHKAYPDIPHYAMPHGKVKIPAAWLIEQCGWKGKRHGETGNHAKQALVIVNYGHATGKEIWDHAQQVQKSVQEKFNIELEPEVNLVG